MLPYCEVSYEINDKLAQNCLPEFFSSLGADLVQSFISVDVKTDGLSESCYPPHLFQLWPASGLAKVAKIEKNKKIKYRQHLLDINSQMSGVGANVLAADGREASRVHADCSLHQR